MKPKPSEIAARFIREDADGVEPTYQDAQELSCAYLRLREASQDVAKVTSGAVVKRLRDVLEESDE